MSATDIDMAVARNSHPKGGRFSLSMSGKFLPYKYYRATRNGLALGLKEQ